MEVAVKKKEEEVVLKVIRAISIGDLRGHLHLLFVEHPGRVLE